jgi:hypothetical protein
MAGFCPDPQARKDSRYQYPCCGRLGFANKRVVRVPGEEFVTIFLALGFFF